MYATFPLYLWNALKEGKEILLEGQLGTLKDPDHGIYPMVTSSSTLAAYGAIGAGVPPYEIKKIVTVCKAYSSAVGAGAFVSARFSVKRLTSLEDAAVMAENTVQPQDVRDVWDGMTVLHLNTAAVCRVLQMWHLQYLTYLAIWMRFRYVLAYDIDGEVTTDFPTTSQTGESKTGDRESFQDGNVISVESRTTRIFRRTAANTSSSSRSRSDSRSPWFPTDQEETILFTEINNWEKSGCVSDACK